MSLGFGFMFPRLVGLDFVAEGIKEGIRTPFNKAIRFYSVTGDRGAGRAAFSAVSFSEVADNPTCRMLSRQKICNPNSRNKSPDPQALRNMEPIASQIEPSTSFKIFFHH